MFDTFPFLLGGKLNYHQYFSLISMLIFFAFALAFYILYYIFKKLEDYFTMKKLLSGLSREDHSEDPSEPILPEKVLVSDKIKLTGRFKENNNREGYDLDNQKQEAFGSATYQKSKLIKFLFWISYFWSLLCVICISFTPICWSAFGKSPIAGAVFILLFIYYARFISDIMEFRPNSVKNLKNKENENSIKFNLKKFARINIVTFRRYKIFYICANVLIIFFSIFLPFLFENTCVSFHNSPIGFRLGNADLSTKLTRQTSENEKCPSGPPCHIYATLPENATNAVFLNFHVNQRHGNIQVFNDSLDHYSIQKTLRYQIKIKRFDPELESIGSRYVYSALITGLQPNSSYAFGIFYDGTFQSIKIYYTMPEKITGNDSLVFVNGGDVGSSDDVRSIANSFTTQMPNVVFIGGDIAYDNGLKTCFHVWDNFLSMTDTISVSLSRLIPVVLAVGNHDVGLNSLSKTNISTSTTDAPLYFQYFPQHYRLNQHGKAIEEIPEINERRTYFYHSFSGLIYFTLDSGYINTFDGYQSRWLNNTFLTYINSTKFAHYHSPSFTGCFQDQNRDKAANVQALLFWNNLFDKYNLTTAYENHNHLLKRTYRIKGNDINSNGTLYLGDGAWGVVNQICQLNEEDDKFFAEISRNQHVWVTKIGANYINYTAIGVKGTIYDQYYQNIV